jgi:RHS repeat-associated protein
MIGPGGMTWTYEYDAANRLTKITNPNNEETTFTYDAAYERTSMTYANGVVTSYTYDAAGRVTGITTKKSDDTSISTYAYTHGNVGNRISMIDIYGTHTYQYDDVYQLTNAVHPQAYNPGETFDYDVVGNRLSSHLSSDYVYDNLNRLLEDDDFTYSYDDNGNLLSKVDKLSGATTTCQYDAENWLVQVDTPTDVVEYQYDGLGRRISKIVNGVVTKFLYDNVDILFELDEDENITARYTHGPGIDEPISVERDTDGDGVFDNKYYYHHDGLGSITSMTDTSGNVAQTYVYDAFGRIVQQTGSVENTYTYTGREWDESAGLYYYRARYYEPISGRFINEDPIGFAGGDTNFYAYVRNNPVNMVDPLGLTLKCPPTPPSTKSVPQGLGAYYKEPIWKDYVGDPDVFHCGYPTYLENREPTKDNPIAECTYDDDDNLVKPGHIDEGCQGTPDQHLADQHPILHAITDTGGICKAGMPAWKASRAKESREEAELWFSINN